MRIASLRTCQQTSIGCTGASTASTFHTVTQREVCYTARLRGTKRPRLAVRSVEQGEAHVLHTESETSQLLGCGIALLTASTSHAVLYFSKRCSTHGSIDCKPSLLDAMCSCLTGNPLPGALGLLANPNQRVLVPCSLPQAVPCYAQSRAPPLLHTNWQLGPLRL